LFAAIFGKRKRRTSLVQSSEPLYGRPYVVDADILIRRRTLFRAEVITFYDAYGVHHPSTERIEGPAPPATSPHT
jgi:hypothetical protein